MTILSEAAAVVAALGLLGGLAAMIAAIRFASRRSAPPRAYPPVTILRPLCGDEPMLEAALQSCCAQDYPDFQIVIGVHDPADAALSTVAKVRRQYPRRDIVVVVNSTRHGANRKVANLVNMLPAARYDLLAISDSDLHLPHDYLIRLVAALEVPGTGLVTAPYLGRAVVPGWPARLGACFINHCFLPSLLLARALGRQDCLGSTMMLRRATLEQAGGMAALADCLAEDNVLAQRVRRLGLSVGLARTVPWTNVAEGSLASLWSHEIRWMRTIRSLVPRALAFSVVQYPLFWAAVAAALSGGARRYVAYFMGAWLMRAFFVIGIEGVMRRRMPRPSSIVSTMLLPVRDVLTVAEIAASYWSDRVTWRGHAMQIDPAKPVRSRPQAKSAPKIAARSGARPTPIRSAPSMSEPRAVTPRRPERRISN